jgi:hypothetical protein
VHRSQFPQYFLAELKHFGEFMNEILFAENKGKNAEIA